MKSISRILSTLFHGNANEGGAAGAVNTRQEFVPAEKALRAFFKQYNCKFKVDEPDGENFRRYYFDFQSGHFLAFIYKEQEGVEVLFPRMFDTSFDRLSIVRSTCNRANTLSLHFKHCYNIDEEENVVNVSISFFQDVVVPEIFKSTLERCFSAQRDFVEAYRNANGNAQALKVDDIEHNWAQNNRETFLLRQQEFLQQDRALQWRPNDTVHLTLRQFVSRLLERPDVALGTVQVIAGGKMTERTEGADSIDLSSILIAGEGMEAKFTHDSATVIVHVTVPEAKGEGERLLVLAMRQQGRDDKTLYYRVSACFEARPISRRNSLHSQHDVMPRAIAVLVARDLTTDLKRQQEFEFMWHDAQDKIMEGKAAELTSEQRLVYDVTDANIGFCLYWGRHHMNQKCYYQALLYFENAFNALRLQFHNMDKALKKTFFDICYFIGFCYCDLGLYYKAFYYLDLVADIGRIDYAMEYINALANSCDLRVFSEIDNVVSDISQQYDLSDEDIPDKIQNFMNFLNRRKGYSWINFGELGYAEKIFKGMLTDPENRDYAISELAYIKKCREAQEKFGKDHRPLGMRSQSGTSGTQGSGGEQAV